MTSLGAIPAWAGEPIARRRRTDRWRGHPRVGGGTSCAAWITCSEGGPSPRGRGNRSSDLLEEAGAGAIPAWAGEPLMAQKPTWTIRGHPRVGGGTLMSSMPPRAMAGPSPRGRGNLLCQMLRCSLLGAIPAWAGEPGPATARSLCHRGHPRVGGGTRQEAVDYLYEAGPSPRGRGNLDNRGAVNRAHGAIPAWAGEPANTPVPLYTLGGHPRVGGGTIALPPGNAAARGPSPRGRGNRRTGRTRRPFKRAIPAWAGEPVAAVIQAAFATGHPRVGGGTTRPCQ